MALNIGITKRERRRKLKSGKTVTNVRYVVQWTDPKTGNRHQRFFERKRDAEDKRNELITSYDRGTYSTQRSTLTVAAALEALVESRKSSVRENTLVSYRQDIRYIVGPLLTREGREAKIRSGKGVAPKNAPLVSCIGHIKVQDLTTRDIRAWHRRICEEVSISAANRAKQFLRAAIELAAEDYEFRPPAMPRGLPRKKGKEGKSVLNAAQIAQLLASAKADPEKGIYYAFPFLTGTRISEQLGLFWQDVDFEANTIHIHQTQRRDDGLLIELTKTEAGQRSIPMPTTLRTMLLAWRVRCPRKDGKLERVFPAFGNVRAWPKPRANGGGPMLYHNFLTRIWHPALKRARLPPVTPHSARHAYISGLQAHGAEVGLAAKLAGHKNPVVTLAYYTHATRSGEDVVAALDEAFAGEAG